MSEAAHPYRTAAMSRRAAEYAEHAALMEAAADRRVARGCKSARWFREHAAWARMRAREESQR
jgi:hypothetical protein